MSKDDHPRSPPCVSTSTATSRRWTASRPWNGPATAPFRTAARAALRKIPAGTPPVHRVGGLRREPQAVRAAGSACATNPIALFVPCHRVVRTDGKLGGFLYGLEIKQALLDHEAKYASEGRSTESRTIDTSCPSEQHRRELRHVAEADAVVRGARRRLKSFTYS